jgi:gliding motility-associated-like protein
MSHAFSAYLRGGWLALCLLIQTTVLLATHNRAGEITYAHLQGNTYRITITTYTKASAVADRPYLKIRWGDEPSNITDAQLDSLWRTNGSGDGENIGNDTKKNIYTGEHTYSGPGAFYISVEDPNRNGGIVNINNGDESGGEDGKTSTSIMAVFSIQSLLVIQPGQNGHNNSVELLYPPLDRACINQIWEHNPVAYDPDGDALVFSLVPCTGVGTTVLEGWESPDDFTSSNADSFTIDASTGDITWDTPLVAGEYNIAIKIAEYRNGDLVGFVIRDMQITVSVCPNQPPAINPLEETYCIGINEQFYLAVSATDPQNSSVDIDATGGPLTSVENTAIWNEVNEVFTWVPQCEEIRLAPYQVTFTATNDPIGVPLTDFETIHILVVAPRVENPIADPGANQIALTWDATPCLNAFDPNDLDDVSYKIYRRGGSFGFTPSECELGVPEYTGYSLIATVEGATNNSFIDTDVNFAGEYCYMVVTCWPDGAISYASEEFCALVEKDTPVMTIASVLSTDAANGDVLVQWSRPTKLDTLNFPGPYVYRLHHLSAIGADTQIFQTNPFTTLLLGDTIFTHTGLSTLEIAHRYYVDIVQVASDSILASAQEVSTLYLTLTPGDNAMTLSYTADVTWTNTQYDIYRRGPGEGDFNLVGTTNALAYTDTNLVNNQLYCYKVVSTGSYNSPDILSPLINNSQEACAQPYDQTPPCAPTLTIDSDCLVPFNALSWTNPNNSCTDDVTAYHVYYTSTLGGTMERIATITGASDTAWFYYPDTNPFSIAGCYAITAVDSLNLWPDGELHQNESAFSNVFCVDNCPAYSIPNVITPNDDALNDLLLPIENRFVESIDLQIFNRWGGLIFQTSDPNIEWNGTHMDTQEAVSGGTYFYTLVVNTIRLTGTVPIYLQGHITVIDPSTPSDTNQ